MIKEQNKLNEVVADLEYDIQLLESEMKNCEDQALGERLFNELVAKQVELALIYQEGLNA